MTQAQVAVRFWRRIDAMVAQGQELLRTFLRLVEIKISRRGTFRFVAAAMRHRIGVILPQGDVVVGTIHHLLGDLSPRKKMMTFVVAGVIGLALLLILLEISVRSELAAEARDVAIDAASASSASVQKMPFEDRFAIQLAGSTLLQSVDPLDALGTIPSSEYSQSLDNCFGSRYPSPDLVKVGETCICRLRNALLQKKFGRRPCPKASLKVSRPYKESPAVGGA